MSFISCWALCGLISTKGNTYYILYTILAGKPALLRVGVRKELSCEGRWFRQCRRRDKGYGWGVTGM